eukprot:761485-Hanusia_phi.AAC.4
MEHSQLVGADGHRGAEVVAEGGEDVKLAGSVGRRDRGEEHGGVGLLLGSRQAVLQRQSLSGPEGLEELEEILRADREHVRQGLLDVEEATVAVALEDALEATVHEADVHQLAAVEEGEESTAELTAPTKWLQCSAERHRHKDTKQRSVVGVTTTRLARPRYSFPYRSLTPAMLTSRLSPDTENRLMWRRNEKSSGLETFWLKSSSKQEARQRLVQALCQLCDVVDVALVGRVHQVLLGLGSSQRVDRVLRPVHVQAQSADLILKVLHQVRQDIGRSLLDRRLHGMS